MLLIGVLFGLAMDYEVFLVSRMREHHENTQNPAEAIVHGVARSGRVVTAAALIMAAVFGGFVFNNDPVIKSIGFALAVGVLIDAFVVTHPPRRDRPDRAAHPRTGLKAGHHVTVLVRDPARLPQRDHRNITVVIGDATRAEDLARSLGGSQAVVSALGAGKARTSDLASRAARALIPAARAAGVSRVVFLSAFGVGDSLPYFKAVPRIFIKLLLTGVFGDKAVADDLIRSSALDWTLVYPTILTNGPFTGTYTMLETPTKKIGGRISRADVADFMLRQADSKDWSHRTAILTH